MITEVLVPPLCFITYPFRILKGQLASEVSEDHNELLGNPFRSEIEFSQAFTESWDHKWDSFRALHAPTGNPEAFLSQPGPRKEKPGSFPTQQKNVVVHSSFIMSSHPNGK